MNRKQADIAAGVLVASILSIGVLGAVYMFRADDAMMGQMSSVPLLRSVGPIVMSIVVASIVGGVYVFVRGQVFPGDVDDAGRTEPDDTAGAEATTDQTAAKTERTPPPDDGMKRRILEVLPEDERRILEPVVESPGLTQVKVRDRSGFSRSKVSQTITDLEERGLLYRERQGRTYRVYPADDLDDRL